nr:hypothetical protein [Herbaspirillum sp.]
MTATSGRNLVGSWLNSGPLGSLERMLLGTSAWASMTCFLTWKDKATPAGRLLFQLAPLAHRTDGIASGLWPTPTVQDSNKATKRWREDFQNNLTAAVFNPEKMLPTPTSRDWKGGYKTKSLTRKDGKSRANDSLENAAMGGVGTEMFSGQLNPAWVEWLMGFPEGWTDLKPSEMPLSRKSPK